jgi:hypothetical protein
VVKFFAMKSNFCQIHNYENKFFLGPYLLGHPNFGIGCPCDIQNLVEGEPINLEKVSI